MKKIFLLFSLILCFSIILSAKSRNVAEASQLASQFVNQPVSGLMKAPSSTTSELTLTYTSSSKNVLYYVFNKANDNGYVIISGDDRAKTILGYTDSGHFDVVALPENLKYWLSFYENEIKSLPDSSLQTSISTTNTLSNIKKVSASTMSAVAPLLGSIQWNQDTPYNNLCPLIPSSTNRCVTGCVATGMAQVMRYYNWPVNGTGTNSGYTTSTNSIVIPALDFSATNYDWANMTQTYSSSSTAAQNLAVATLMYHCGVAVNMDYGSSSSASTTNMALALKNKFGYDSNLQLYPRDYFTRAEWKSFLTTELNASRPVLYSGQADSGGHLFVCDGYDSNGLFHFNWGWGGMSNGYFEISALDPSSQGIGSSTGGYNSYQSIVTGLQKPGSSTTPTYLICTSKALTCSNTSVARTGSFTTTGNSVFNLGVNTFSGSIGLGLYDGNGTLTVLKSYASSLSANYGYSSCPITSSIPTGIANGNYKLYLVYKATSDANWQIVRGKVGTANYLDIIVGSATVIINTPQASSAILNLNSLTVTGNLYQNKTGRFNINVINTGNEYNSKLGINLISTSSSSVYQLVTTESVNIAAGETRSLDFTGIITLTPGEYTVTAVYDPANNYSSSTTFSQLGTALTKNVLTAPTGEPVLTLSSIISFPNSSSVEKTNAVLSAQITNTTGFFDNKLIAFIFPTTTGSSLTYLGYQSAVFDTNEQKTVSFTGPVDLTPGDYRIAIYYLNSSSSWSRVLPSNYSMLTFTLVDNKTDIRSLNDAGFEMYPNPVNDVLKLKSNALIKRVLILDLIGKQMQVVKPADSELMSIDVSSLKPGAYVIKVETADEVRTGKFIKN